MRLRIKSDRTLDDPLPMANEPLRGRAGGTPAPAARLRLCRHGDRQLIHDILLNLSDFGSGSAAIELLASETVLWLHHEDDAKLVQTQFSDVVNT